jgi:hypothetical protein
MLSVCIIQETRVIDYAATYKREDTVALSATRFNLGLITSLGRGRCRGNSLVACEVRHQNIVQDLVSYEQTPTCTSPVF